MEVPEDLIDRALRTSGEGVTATVRRGLRAKVLARKHRARLAGTLIAQSCIDHGVRLVTRDADFRHFARLGGLRLGV